MAENTYEWDNDNIRQMSRDLKTVGDELASCIEKYKGGKDELLQSWQSAAGETAHKKLNLDFKEVEAIYRETKELADLLQRSVDSYYSSCEQDIAGAYNIMQTAANGAAFGGGGGGGFR